MTVHLNLYYKTPLAIWFDYPVNPVFIRNFAFTSIPAVGLNGQPPYEGILGKCDFDVSAYQDNLFTVYGIAFPPGLQKAVTKRRAEYLAGRFVARQVLNMLGPRDYLLENGPDRAPCWPDGIQGTLSHNNNRVLCAAQIIPLRLSSSGSGIGVDVESWITDDKTDDIWPGIISDEEYHQLQTGPLPFSQMLTLVFSAKESLFKAIYPQLRCYCDFLDVRLVECTLESGRFELELLRELSPEFMVGRRFQGCFKLMETDVRTFIAY